MSTKQRPKTNTPNRPTPLRLTEALDTKLAEACEKTGLKRADVLRLALDRGIDRLVEQLGTHAAA